MAANTRALRRAQSDKVFVSKAGVVIEEADETGFWLEFLVKIELVPRSTVAALPREANELIAIFTASRKTVQARLEREKRKKSEAKGKRTQPAQRKSSPFTFEVDH